MKKKKPTKVANSRPNPSAKKVKKGILQQNYIILGFILLVAILALTFQSKKTSYNTTNSNNHSRNGNSYISWEYESGADKTLANPEPQRVDCPEGFYFYENNTYSLCYPDTLIAYVAENVVDQENGEIDIRAIDIVDEKANAVISVLPSFNGTMSTSECYSQEEVSVSGGISRRYTLKDDRVKPCGNVFQVHTVVSTGNQLPLTLLYRINEGGTLKFLNDYPIIEQSLKIK